MKNFLLFLLFLILTNGQREENEQKIKDRFQAIMDDLEMYDFSTLFSKLKLHDWDGPLPLGRLYRSTYYNQPNYHEKPVLNFTEKYFNFFIENDRARLNCILNQMNYPINEEMKGQEGIYCLFFFFGAPNFL